MKKTKLNWYAAMMIVIGTRLGEGERGLTFEAASGVAPRHCVLIERDGEGLCVPEGGETRLDGRRLESATRLRAGDRLVLGSSAEVELIQVIESTGTGTP